MKPTATILLYKVRKKKNGKYPVKLRVIYQRDHKDFRLGIDLTEEEFTEANKLKPTKKYVATAAEIIKNRNKANEVIAGLKPFTFEKFEKEFFGHHKDASDIFPFFEQYIRELKSEDRIKTAVSYQTTLNIIQKFHGKKKLGLYDITPSFLKKFQNWMVEKDRSPTTVGIYVRSLRAVYNYCIKLGVIKKDENYPFGISKYVIPAGKNIKKALKLSEIKQIHDYESTPGTFEDRAKDFWLFSYYCNGMNFKDILMLKRKSIDGDMLRFVREKTKRTSQGSIEYISCHLNDKAKAIIEKWGGEDLDEDAYVFPILSKEDPSEKKAAKIDQFIQNTYKNMERICKHLKLDKKVTTYAARHSSASVLKRSGVSVEKIQEALGHSSPIITQRYLDSFEDDTKKELSQALIAF